MQNHNESPSAAELHAAFLGSATMPAVGMTTRPEVSQVASCLEMLEVPTPRPGRGQVAVALRASAMHIDEIYAAQGTALGRFFGPKDVSPSTPCLLGSSVSGVVVALGEGTSGFQVGDAVLTIPHHMGEFGSWARYRCVSEKMILPKPEAWTHVEAAAATMAACVSWGAAVTGKAKAGSRCVVVGASGSIGLMLVQYLKSLGCQVIGVCSAANAELVLAHGAAEIIDYHCHDFGERLRGRSDQQDLVFDCIGGRDIEASANLALGRHGDFVTVVGPEQYIGERKLSRWQFTKLMAHIGWRMTASLFRGPRYRFAATIPRSIVRDAVQQAVEHDIRMPVEEVIGFELGQVADAVQLLTTHRARGRIVIDFERASTSAL